MKADLNALYLRFTSDPVKYEQEFWTAVQQHLERATRDEDMAADAIVKVLAGLKHYQHTGKFSAWLNTVARTSIADAYNKQKEDAMCPQTMERLVSSVPVQISIRLDLSAVEDVVDRMLCEQVLDGFSMTEAAARCNLSTAAARKRLRRLGNKLGSACPLLS